MEIDPAVLQLQTSLSETRQPAESAIHRSVDVPHGVSLTSGLHIRIGYKVRDGCLKDIWHCALNNDSHETILQWNKIQFTVSQVNTMLHQLADFFSKIGLDKKELELDDTLSKSFAYSKIAICVKELKAEATLAIMSAFFVSDLTVINYTQPPTELPDDCDTVFVDDLSLVWIKKLGFKNIIYIGDAPILDVIRFNDIVDFKESVTGSKNYEYNPSLDFMNFNNYVYSEVSGDKEIKFYQRNFVASVSSKLMSLHTAYSWNEDDSLLILGSNTSAWERNVIHTTLCGLLTSVRKIQFETRETVGSLQDLAQQNATILCTEPMMLSQLTRSGKKHIKKSFLLQRAEVLNSHGVFASFGKLESTLNLKLIYVYESDQIVSTAATNLSKSVMGSRIVKETHCPASMGPIFKTNVQDYRITQFGKYHLMGVPSNCLEAKVKKESEEAKVGTLCIRGLSLGKGQDITFDEEYWYDTKIKGTFAQDGCFYGEL
ncbi:hypothetical protein DAMA08_005800 [Martiniozyma asiatica (nom. inval.)]|nr:hypothetical protein DAMA08_005800 [Martiniozyma asiatica]